MAEINLGRVRGSDANVTKTNVENALGFTPADEEIIGLLSELTTDEKENLVLAINEVKSQSNEVATDLATLLVGGEVYSLPRLRNGWLGTLQYKKNGLGMVSIWGEVTSGIVAQDYILEVLPIGFRPNQHNIVTSYIVGGINSGKGHVSFMINKDNGVITVTVNSNLAQGENIRISHIFQA